MLRREAKAQLDAVTFLSDEVKENILSQMEFDKEDVKAKDLEKYDVIEYSIDGNSRVRGIVLDPSIKGVNNKEYILVYTPDSYKLISCYTFDHLDKVIVEKPIVSCEKCDKKDDCDEAHEDDYMTLDELIDEVLSVFF